MGYKHRMDPGDDLDARVRLAMFAHLDRVSAANPGGASSEEINSFVFDGTSMRLMVKPWHPQARAPVGRVDDPDNVYATEWDGSL